MKFIIAFVAVFGLVVCRPQNQQIPDLQAPSGAGGSNAGSNNPLSQIMGGNNNPLGNIMGGNNPLNQMADAGGRVMEGMMGMFGGMRDRFDNMTSNFRQQFGSGNLLGGLMPSNGQQQQQPGYLRPQSQSTSGQSNDKPLPNPPAGIQSSSE